MGETASVQELSSTNFHIAGITASGPTHDNRLTTGSTVNPAIVSVPFGGAANVTTATFTDAVNTGQLQLCKVSSDQALQSTAFQFSWSYTVNGTPANGSTALKPGECSTLPTAIPVVDAAGHAVPIAIAEAATVGVDVQTFGVDNGVISSPNTAAGTVTATVAQGLTTVTYTNTLKPARTLVVCKIAADDSTASQSFMFSVNGGSAFPVAAGQCSDAIALPTVGETASVQELDTADFHLVDVTATGPALDNRLSSNATDPIAIVSTPFGGAANETTVTFTNAVDTSQLVMCKSNPDGTLTGQTFSLSYLYVSGLATGLGTAPLTPGDCSTPSAPIPVVDPAGHPVVITISELPVLGAELDDAGVVNGTVTVTAFALGFVDVTPNAGTTTVTLANNSVAQIG